MYRGVSAAAAILSLVLLRVCVLCFVLGSCGCPSCVWAVLLVCLGLAVALLVFGSLYYTGGGGES